jgi:protein tyrosine/serine phosphatase
MPDEPEPAVLEPVRFDRLGNFRDYGGYPVRGGGRVRRGVLYRSAHPAEASPGDLSILQAIGLEAVVDLRGRSEREQWPSPWTAGFPARVFVIEEETGGLLGHLLLDATSTPGELDAAGWMRQSYAMMPFRWRLKRALRNHFEALAGADGAVLVHCAAGKDRTGLAAALLLSLLEVEREHIVADFMLTETVAANVQLALQAVRTTHGRELTEHQARELAGVRPQYIEAALDAVLERHGSIAAYLRDALDVPNEWLDVIRSKLIDETGESR